MASQCFHFRVPNAYRTYLIMKYQAIRLHHHHYIITNDLAKLIKAKNY